MLMESSMDGFLMEKDVTFSIKLNEYVEKAN